MRPLPVYHRQTTNPAIAERRFGHARRTGSPAMAPVSTIPIRRAWRCRCNGRRLYTLRPDRQTAITAAPCTSRSAMCHKAMAEPPRPNIIRRSGTILSATANTASRNTKQPANAPLRLRVRVDGDIAAFLAAFDAALAEDTQGSRSALREATDRLLRAGARTRIELERLEARMPLPPRDNIGRGEAAWRQR